MIDFVTISIIDSVMSAQFSVMCPDMVNLSKRTIRLLRASVNLVSKFATYLMPDVECMTQDVACILTRAAAPSHQQFMDTSWNLHERANMYERCRSSRG